MPNDTALSFYIHSSKLIMSLYNIQHTPQGRIEITSRQQVLISLVHMTQAVLCYFHHCVCPSSLLVFYILLTNPFCFLFKCSLYDKKKNFHWLQNRPKKLKQVLLFYLFLITRNKYILYFRTICKNCIYIGF